MHSKTNPSMCRVPYDRTDAASLPGSKLEQVVSIPLAGLVESMAVLRGRSSSQKDALLLTFRFVLLAISKVCMQTTTFKHVTMDTLAICAASALPAVAQVASQHLCGI